MFLVVCCVFVFVSAVLGQQDPYQPDHVLDFLCIQLSHRPCDTHYAVKICASDGRTYNTLCEYQKVRCVFREMNFVKYGDCDA